ncbi:unnamed protein product, partial [Urochloa humidicola]
SHPPTAHIGEREAIGASRPRGGSPAGRRRGGRMGKIPIRMKAVVYSLSPFQQKVMPGLWKDITTKIHHKVTENWISAGLLLGPVVGTYQYAMWYKEQEKLSHRY